MSAVNENPFNKNLTLNNLNKENEWKSRFALRFEIYGNRALKVILALILIIGMLPIFNFPLFKNEVAVADDAPEFGSVAINQGARISLSGNKSITSLATSTGGNLKMFSDQTGGIEVAGTNVNSSVNSFLSTNYSGDALLGSLSSASLLSVNDINSYRYFLPVGDKAYWLSDTGSKGSLSYQAYAKANNTLDNVSLKATGKIDGRNYENTVIANGPYAWNKGATLSNYTIEGKGAKWDLSSSSVNKLDVYRTDKSWFGVGATVYNNPNLLSTGKDWNGKAYRSTTVRKLTQESGAKLFGYVKDGLIYQALPGDQIKRGTTCVFCFVKHMKELKDQSGFAGNSFNQTGFVQTQQDFQVLNRYVETQDVYGMSAFNAGGKTISGQNITSSQFAIRPSMVLNASKIAFFRNATNAGATTNSALRNTPISNALKGSSYKAVVKDDSLKLSVALSASNFETDQGTVRIEGSTLHIPYGAKTLKIKNANAGTGNYVSALSSTQGQRKYGLLGASGEVELDLNSFLSTSVLGSESDVSFFAEQVNGSGVSDRISAQPVSMKIVVSEAVPFKFTYNIDGGSGVDIPESSEVKSGTSFSLADGSLLQKEGNPFAKWLVTYRFSGDIYQTQLLMNSSQLFTMPNADVTATALYSGISAGKDSTTEGQEKFLVTFDPNGGLWGDSEYAIAVPIIPGGQCADPGKPKRDGYKFTGWFNREVGGEQIDLAKVVFTGHTYLYAHWEFVNVFLAEKGTDPYEISHGLTDAEFYSIEKVKTIARQIVRGYNPNVDVFNATNDRWHLFALFSGDGSDENDWSEFRIIHVGQHDGDGSGLTFQQTHTDGYGYSWNGSSSTDMRNWADSSARTTINERYNKEFPTELSNKILKVNKRYSTTAGSDTGTVTTSYVEDSLWILSGTEIVNDAKSKFYSYWKENNFEGSTYAFYKAKDFKSGVLPFSEQAKYIRSLMADRKGQGIYSRGMFTRSISPLNAEELLLFEPTNLLTTKPSKSSIYPISVCFCL